MIYVTSIDKAKVTIHEVYSDSTISITLHQLDMLKNMGLHVENMDSDLRHMKAGFEGVKKTDGGCIVVGRDTDCEYAILRPDTIIDRDGLISKIKSNEVMNAKLAEDMKSVIITGEKDLRASRSFIEEISSKYESFVLKAMTLGYDCRFTWEIMGEEVIYSRYIGKSDRVIVPNFVTVIKSYAFSFKRSNEVITVEIGDRVHTIGTNIFYGTTPKPLIEIPSTVKLQLNNRCWPEEAREM